MSKTSETCIRVCIDCRREEVIPVEALATTSWHICDVCKGLATNKTRTAHAGRLILIEMVRALNAAAIFTPSYDLSKATLLLAKTANLFYGLQPIDYDKKKDIDWRAGIVGATIIELGEVSKLLDSVYEADFKIRIKIMHVKSTGERRAITVPAMRDSNTAHLYEDLVDSVPINYNGGDVTSGLMTQLLAAIYRRDVKLEIGDSIVMEKALPGGVEADLHEILQGADIDD